MSNGVVSTFFKSVIIAIPSIFLTLLFKSVTS